MMHGDRIFRIFFSSAFEDMKAKRNALPTSIFQSRENPARRAGYRFQAIDFLLGVSEV